MNLWSGFALMRCFYDQTRRDFKDKHKKRTGYLMSNEKMGISGEYRLEYMPLMIQKKTGGISYSNDKMGTFIIIICFTLDVLYLYFTVPMTWDVFMYTMC